MRVNPVLPLPRPRPQTARSVVDLILNARSADDLRQYGWEKGQATADGRFRWKGTDEHKGQYRTQKTEPGTGRGGKKKDATAEPAAPGEEGAEKQPAQKKPATPRKPKVDHNEIGDKIEKMLEGDFSDDDIAAVKQSLMGLTVAQLGELKKRFGVKGGRTKADIAGRIGGNVEGKRKPAEQPAPSQPAEPQQAQVGVPASEVPGSPEQQAPRLPEAPQQDGEKEWWEDRPKEPAPLRTLRQVYGLNPTPEQQEEYKTRKREHAKALNKYKQDYKAWQKKAYGTPELEANKQPAAPAPNPREQRSRSGLGQAPQVQPKPKPAPQPEPQPADTSRFDRELAPVKATSFDESLEDWVGKDHGLQPEQMEEFRKRYAEAESLVDENPLRSGYLKGEVVRDAARASQRNQPRNQRNRAGLGKAHALVRPKPASVLPAGKPQSGADADREARIAKYRERAAKKKPLFNARSPVDLILNARSPHQARPLLYAWVQKESKRRPGRFYWQNTDNPRDKRYQQNMPGQRPGKHTPVASVDPREHLLRVLEAPYKVADYYLTSLRERLQRMRPAAVEALRQEFSSIV